MGTRDEGGEHEGGEAQLERGGEVAPHHRKRGLAKVDGAAEVAAQDVSEEHPVLHGQRPIEAQLGAHAEDLAAGRVGRQQQGHGVAGQPHDDEHHGRDEPQRDQRAKSRWARYGRNPRIGQPLTRPTPAEERRVRERGYARRNLKLNLRISNCWFGFGVHSTYFCSP